MLHQESDLWSVQTMQVSSYCHALHNVSSINVRTRSYTHQSLRKLFFSGFWKSYFKWSVLEVVQKSNLSMLCFWHYQRTTVAFRKPCWKFRSLRQACRFFWLLKFHQMPRSTYFQVCVFYINCQDGRFLLEVASTISEFAALFCTASDAW